MLFASALFIFQVLADPRRVRRSGLRNRVDNATIHDVGIGLNWAGGLLSGPPQTFYHITGTLVVPEVHGSDDSIAGAWVGIDGSDCPDALLQTGIEMSPDSIGGPEYYAWYEWFPDPPTDFNLDVSAGDILTLTIAAYSSTQGFATIDNLSTGQTDHVVLTSEHALCFQNAEWIVEDPKDENGNQRPLANFDTIQFYDTLASGPAGSYTPDQAQPVLIATPDGERLLTSVAMDEFSVTVGYIDG